MFQKKLQEYFMNVNKMHDPAQEHCQRSGFVLIRNLCFVKRNLLTAETLYP